jgi:hypothetical protein
MLMRDSRAEKIPTAILMPHRRYLLLSRTDSATSTIALSSIVTMSMRTREISPMIQQTDNHEPFVVEVWGKLAGVVLKKGDAFRFHAIAPPFLALDGAEFAKPGLARLAAARLDPHTRDAGRSLGSASHSASSLPL